MIKLASSNPKYVCWNKIHNLRKQLANLPTCTHLKQTLRHKLPSCCLPHTYQRQYSWDSIYNKGLYIHRSHQLHSKLMLMLNTRAVLSPFPRKYSIPAATEQRHCTRCYKSSEIGTYTGAVFLLFTTVCHFGGSVSSGMAEKSWNQSQGCVGKKIHILKAASRCLDLERSSVVCNILRPFLYGEESIGDWV